MDKIPIREFKIDNININPHFVIVGQKGSGMSWKTRDFIFNNKTSHVKNLG